MTDLTVNSGRAFQGEVRESMFEVGANLEVFAGQAMIAGANGIVNATPGAGADFVGFARDYVNNLTNAIPNGGAARAAQCKCAVEGYAWLDVAKGSAIASTDVGVTVYASDGNTFTTSAGTNNVKVGRIVNVDRALGSNTGSCLVYFNVALASLLT